MREEHLPSSLFAWLQDPDISEPGQKQLSAAPLQHDGLFGQAGDSVSCDGSGQGRPRFS